MLHEPEGAGARDRRARLRAPEHRAGRTRTSLANGFSRVDALTLLEAHDADAKVLIVGHEPTFSQVVYDFTGARVDFKKGGVAALRASRTSGELLVLARPKELEALAAGAKRR